MHIDGIKSGIVLDHIKEGKCMEIYNYLGLEHLDCPVAIIKNVKSTKMGKKDIIKIDADIDINLDVLGYIDHDITVNIVKNGEITEKRKLELPKQLKNVVKCKNPRCITSVETDLDSIFKLTDEKNRTYRCIYCDSQAEK